MIGIVGHADLTVATLEALEGRLADALAAAGAAGLRGVVRAGSGLAEAFARAARTRGVPLVVVLPAQGALPVPLPEREAIATGELIMQAEQVRLVEFDPLQHGARVHADEQMISGCRRLLAVWDGSRSTSRDATAHLVAYARGLGVPVDVLWPPRAARAADDGAATGRTAREHRMERRKGPGSMTTERGGTEHGSGPDRQPAPTRMVQLTTDRAMELLSDVSLGRVVFSHQALPAVRPVNHIVDEGAVVFLSHSGAAVLGPAGSGSVVAYQADRIDEETHTGWSVVVTGTASLVRDQDELDRYRQLLMPWVAAEMYHVVRISADIVTGFQLAG